MLPSKEHSFISYLQSLVGGDNRAALANLRRGLGQVPGSVPQMYPYVVPHLPVDPPSWLENSYYLIASLFAFHPVVTEQGNFGKHMANARTEGNDAALERRFTALLSAHPDDLPDYLRQAVSLLKSKEIPINWNQLLTDLQLWSHPEYGDRVRKRWATAYWGYRKTENE